MIKYIRFIFQFLFFTLTTAIFVKLIENFFIIGVFNSLHVLTSLSTLPWIILPTFFSTTLIMLILPFIFGRLYCSYICPVGFTQDIFIKIGKKLRLPQKVFKWHLYFSFFVLALALGLVIFKSPLYGILDHYSLLGRVFNIHVITGFLSLVLTIIFIVLISIVSLVFPRLYCNSLCPTGALYSLFSRRSLFSIKITNSCNDCGACISKCPTLALQGTWIKSELCTTCLECLNVCPQNAIKFKRKKLFKKGPKNNKSNRRVFLKKSLALILGGISSYALGLRPVHAKKASKAIVPPGAKSTDSFIGKCTSCYLCVSICPTKVLTPTLDLETFSLKKPQMNFDKSYCSYECNSCLSICPTNALTYYCLEQKKQIKIGYSVIDEKICVPYKHGRTCLACAEHCPTMAIKLVDYKGVKAPVIDKNYCTGCGACQYICPTTPKSIIVHPEPIHLTAYSPLAGKENASAVDDSNTDFPF